MSEIAFVSSPGLALGTEAAGLRFCPVEDSAHLDRKLLELVRDGVSVAVVTADLAGTRFEELRTIVEAAGSEMTLLVLPGRGETAREYLRYLRSRFAAALGVDVWETVVKRSGSRS
jgi:vacuolar-type H+-ATPase subunit F/Vma7